MDRNSKVTAKKSWNAWSLSARRAWIEISHDFYVDSNGKVALRKESVDRNAVRLCQLVHNDAVALRKESVDRNVGQSRNIKLVSGRSPQGERG